MKHYLKILSILLVTLIIACNKENPDQPLEEIMEEMMEETSENQVICDDQPFEFNIEAAGRTLKADSCWVLYIPHDPNSSVIINEKWAVLKWQFPGSELWDSSFAFAYGDSNSELESGRTYDARQINGVIYIAPSGLDGEMFGALGEEGAVTFNIDEFNPESGYICGDFEGRALYSTNEYVDLKGSFKGHLNP